MHAHRQYAHQDAASCQQTTRSLEQDEPLVVALLIVLCKMSHVRKAFPNNARKSWKSEENKRERSDVAWPYTRKKELTETRTSMTPD